VFEGVIVERAWYARSVAQLITISRVSFNQYGIIWQTFRPFRSLPISHIIS
jgi:hypothetical protein